MSFYSLQCLTAPSNKAAQVITLLAPPAQHLLLLAEEPITGRKTTNPWFTPATRKDTASYSSTGSFSHCRQIKKNKTGQTTSKMISALPTSMITTIFQKSRLPQGFNCSVVKPLPFKDPIYFLAQASMCPDPQPLFATHVFCLQAGCWSQEAFPRESFVRTSKFVVKSFFWEHFLTKEKIKENILLKNTRSVGEEALSSSILWVGFITLRSHFTELVS